MKPIILAGSWVIKAPRQRLYQIVTDFEKAAKYFPLVANSLKIIKKQGNNLTIEAVPKTFGIPFKVLMETQLFPNKGFKSINTSIVAIENESFMMEEIAEGTKIIYRNEVQIKNNYLKLLGKLLIGKPALWFWKFAYIDRLEEIATTKKLIK
ncbi:MAG: hypothetical protein ACOZAN_05130 [Patescibacteria group bacterium]